MHKFTTVLLVPCAALLLAVGAVAADRKEATKSAPAELSSQAAVERALVTKCSCELDDVPLSDVVALFARQRKINFVIDQLALDDAGIDPVETPVTLKVSGIPFKSLLSLALEPHGLTWTIRHEVLVVTTKEEAETQLVTKVYDVFDLLVNDADGTDRDTIATGEVDFDSLIELIQSSVQPDTWVDFGGDGYVDGFVNRSIVALVVFQTAPMNDKVATLLESLRKKKKRRTGEKKPRTPERPARKPGAVNVVAYQVLTRGDRAGTTGEQDLIAILKEFVEPESWQSNKAAARAIPGALVIKQTPAAHEKIRQLLSAAGVLQRAVSKTYYDPVDDGK